MIDYAAPVHAATNNSPRIHSLPISPPDEPHPAKEPFQYNDHRIAIHAQDAPCKPWPRRPHARRRFHEVFFQWYAAHEEKFAIKLELLKRTDRGLDIGFCKIDRIVTAVFTDSEIAINVDWQDTFWDVIQWFEAPPKKVPGGYVCDLCPQDDRPVFSSREDLWNDHIFEPFLAWVNDDLATAEAISLSGTPDRITSARLAKSRYPPRV